MEEWDFILSLILLLGLGAGIAKKKGAQRFQNGWHRKLEDQSVRPPMMTVWETEADVVRTQEKRWGSADRKREWASLAEHGFVQCFPLSQLSQQPCTILAGCRSGALEEAGEG